MDWLYYIFIPLVSALISGGLTFAGVLITIRHSNKIFKKEYQEREEERKRQQWKENKEKNKVIMQGKPQLIIVNDAERIDNTLAVKLLPFVNFTINNILESPYEDELLFDYPPEIFEDDFWDSYNVILKNIGGKITSGFIHSPYKAWVNLYDLGDFFEGNRHYLQYFSELVFIPPIENGECLKLVIYYPKTMPLLTDIPHQSYKGIGFDIYMRDEHANEWRQVDFNHKHLDNGSEPVSCEEYGMHYRKELAKWQVIRQLYDYNIKREVPMKFEETSARLILDKKTQEYNDWDTKFRRYRIDVEEGKILLNSKYPSEYW